MNYEEQTFLTQEETRHIRAIESAGKELFVLKFIKCRSVVLPLGVTPEVAEQLDPDIKREKDLRNYMNYHRFHLARSLMMNCQEYPMPPNFAPEDLKNE